MIPQLMPPSAFQTKNSRKRILLIPASHAAANLISAIQRAKNTAFGRGA